VGILEGFTSSQVEGISADGRFVVGYSENGAGATMAFRSQWATAEGPVALGVLAGGVSSSARAVSRDGFAVVGTSEGTTGERAFRWTGSLLDLGVWSTGDTGSSAADVSADGNVVLVTSDGADGSRLAFRWQLGAGNSPIIGMEEARGLSADGQISVGNRLGSGNEAIYAAPGIQVLPTLPGDAAAYARALSSDGSVAVGVSGNCGCRGVRWQGGVQQETVGLFRALATNEDGSVVGGDSVDTSCSGGKAAIWTPRLGKQAVACDLLPAQLIPNGWSLTLVTAISDDGRVIAGEGVNPSLAEQGWVAVLGPDCRIP
jgi:probable HAF family extracellular repeat protein